MLEEQLNVGFLVVISILFLLMKRRHLLSSIQMRVTHVLEQSCGGLLAVLPKPLLLLIIFANKFVQAEEKGLKLDVRPNNKSEAVVLCITQLRTDLIKVSRR